MKKSKLFLASCALGLVLMSCQKENLDSITVITTVDFENVKLNSDSIWNGSDGSGSFTTKVATFNNSYNSAWFSWSGFACSAKTDTKTVGYSNQYSVSVGAGALNSKKFAIAYNIATLLCDSNIYGNFSIKSLMLTNSTYTYFDMKNGSTYSKKFVAGDWYKVTITGYLNNMKTTAIDYYLADFRNGKTFISNTWNTVDVSSLGKVDKVIFTFDSSDKDPVYGMNTPAYACIDNIEFTQTISSK
jgi:hypothetical protein